MTSYRVLVSDKCSPKGIEIFRAAEGVEVDYEPGMPPDRLLEVIGNYHGLVVRSATKVTPEVIAKADKLKCIARAGSGVDNINLPAASERGIVVMNTPGGNTVTTAEHAICLMCSLLRNIPQATASMKAGKWEKSKLGGRELFKKTLGVIGLGNIGKIVADRAQGLRMTVVAHDPFVTEDQAKELGVELLPIDDLLGRADIVTLHVAVNDATRGMIDAAAIDKMKPGAFLINAARGGIVDEAAVAAAVESKKLSGAAFDVYGKEPPPADNPLLGVDNIILTPHLGASTQEAQDNVAIAAADQIVAVLTKNEIRNAVNEPKTA